MAVHVCGKGVAGLVGHYFHIVLGAVKVGKDKGNLIIGDAGAVATAAFAFGGKNIQQFLSSIMRKNSLVSGESSS